MKRNLLSVFYSLTFILSVILLASCGDSYSPITLVGMDGKTMVANNDTIKLKKFTDGEEYEIKGGNGKYFIEIINKGDDDIVKYSYNGEILSVSPQNEGNCYLSLCDTEENETRIVVVVEKKDRSYDVESLSALVEGDELKVGTQKEIEQLVMNNSTVKVGGKFEFQYDNSNNGIVKIMISENAQYISGTFTETKLYNPVNGEEIMSLEITVPGTDKFTLYLSEKDMTLSQDVTDNYKHLKPEYNNLEKALLVYKLSIPADMAQADNNGK